ncbi:DUF2958 domain-containing protein [Methylobacterium sp. SD274]|uniref:DUF2958 domain-containing protein n=1 Tax=Methylobacterium sp. SD274 TaxID=2782009 RepID=UPI001A968EB1|nr:DUF2958 domain-containing protein [Methylobacterium sp. SD274]MBO1021446.1 DUF2958 domain-containing protein [Methylobacterium sp. SD274]
MKLITKEIKAKLLANGRRQEPVRGTVSELDLVPVAHIFDPFGGGRWLLSEIYPHDRGLAFGLCDLGFGEAELGDVSLKDLENLSKNLENKRGVGLERDRYFKPTKTIGEYADVSSAAGRIEV